MASPTSEIAPPYSYREVSELPRLVRAEALASSSSGMIATASFRDEMASSKSFVSPAYLNLSDRDVPNTLKHEASFLEPGLKKTALHHGCKGLHPLCRLDHPRNCSGIAEHRKARGGSDCRDDDLWGEYSVHVACQRFHDRVLRAREIVGYRFFFVIVYGMRIEEFTIARTGPRPLKPSHSGNECTHCQNE